MAPITEATWSKVCSLLPLKYWDLCFESYRGHGCTSAFSLCFYCRSYVRTYARTSRGPIPHPGGTTKHLYAQLVSDSAAQAAGHPLLTAEVRCCIPEHSTRDLGRRTCRYAAGCSQITRAFLGNHHYTIVSC